MDFIYQKPIISSDLNNIRDPFIIKDKDGYYLTGSSAPFWQGVSPGVKLWHSKDLLNWTYLGLIIDEKMFPKMRGTKNDSRNLKLTNIFLDMVLFDNIKSKTDQK